MACSTAYALACVRRDRVPRRRARRGASASLPRSATSPGPRARGREGRGPHVGRGEGRRPSRDPAGRGRPRAHSGRRITRRASRRRGLREARPLTTEAVLALDARVFRGGPRSMRPSTGNFAGAVARARCRLADEPPPTRNAGARRGARPRGKPWTKTPSRDALGRRRRRPRGRARRKAPHRPRPSTATCARSRAPGDTGPPAAPALTREARGRDRRRGDALADERARPPEGRARCAQKHALSKASPRLPSSAQTQRAPSPAPRPSGSQA